MKLGLYLHLPFCISRCSYCDFFTVVGKEDAIPAYVEAICKEIRLYAAPDQAADTVYFGGGTPSLLSPRQFEQILETIRASFRLEADTEITCETNPETVDRAKLAGFRAAGINRLSLGVQSFHDSELHQLDRAHDSRRAKGCISDARDAGFGNLSIDLISALPGMKLASWTDNLRKAVSLQPDHISAYTLEYHPGTRVSRERSEGRLLPAQETLEREMYLRTIDFLGEHGYAHYEISNFARPGFESRHNSKYWLHQPYLGFGTSAHSFQGRSRYWNHSNLARYLTDLSQGRKPIAGSEELSEAQLRLERITLGLRTREGAPWDGGELPASIPPDLLRKDNGRIALTREGFALYDSICEQLVRFL